jgi:hypothetical protein
MAGFRCSLILVSILVFGQFGKTQTGTTPTRVSNAVNKVYSLADLGDDPNLCKWIAETIPRMIKPGCWNGQSLCYFAPAKVMAIHQTPEVHAQVEEFLANMRKSLPRDKATASRTKQDAHVVPAQFNPEALRPAGPASASQAYPVPAALPTPKHLFHFIIRYEGAGIIDSNVTKFTEALTKAGSMNGSSAHWNGPMPSATLTSPPTYLAPTNSDGGPTGLHPAPVPNAPRTMPPAEPFTSSAAPPMQASYGSSAPSLPPSTPLLPPPLLR